MEKKMIFFALIVFVSCNRMRYEQRLESQGKIKCGWYGKLNSKEVK
jgi:hypothetical protein